MPKIKKSKEADSLDCLSKNISICCKVFGAEKISVIMGISEASVYNKIKFPINVKIPELLRLSAYIGTSLDDLIKPLQLTGKGVKNS